LQLRTLTYNIHKGFSATNTEFMLHRIRDAIRESKADLVFLQEVQGEHATRAKDTTGWPTESQFEFLADQVWAHHAYGKNAVYDVGHHGNAILSKYPILEAENLDISANKVEDRGMLHGVIEIPETAADGGPKSAVRLHAICSHLGLLEHFRKFQTEKICERIKTRIPANEPVILAGDFNDWRERLSDALHANVGMQEAFMQIKGRHPKTYPSFFPLFALDRIYYRGLTPVSVICLNENPWKKLSDHAALIADFQL
jgi:endonuclease/exonuclease/phosphatase family metal-dependent hydrolase